MMREKIFFRTSHFDEWFEPLESLLSLNKESGEVLIVLDARVYVRVCETDVDEAVGMAQAIVHRNRFLRAHDFRALLDDDEGSVAQAVQCRDPNNLDPSVTVLQRAFICPNEDVVGPLIACFLDPDKKSVVSTNHKSVQWVDDPPKISESNASRFLFRMCFVPVSLKRSELSTMSPYCRAVFDHLPQDPTDEQGDAVSCVTIGSVNPVNRKTVEAAERVIANCHARCQSECVRKQYKCAFRAVRNCDDTVVEMKKRSKLAWQALSNEEKDMFWYSMYVGRSNISCHSTLMDYVRNEIEPAKEGEFDFPINADEMITLVQYLFELDAKLAHALTTVKLYGMTCIDLEDFAQK